jgi:acetyl esterase/lipase
MRRFARNLSRLSAIAAFLMILHPRPGWLAALLMVPKGLAGALSPFTAIAGMLGALGGLLTGDLLSILTGIFGAVFSRRYIQQVTAPDDSFERAFGVGWQEQIPNSIQHKLPPDRWSWLHLEADDVPWEENVVVETAPGREPKLLADLWQSPAGVEPSGIGILYLHGSGWHHASNDFLTRWLFRRLARQGHTILDLDYRLTPLTNMFGMVRDVKRAIIWMKSQAQVLAINPERIVLAGGSAGAHLALLAAYTPNLSRFQPTEIDADTRVRAVVAYYGIPDLRSHQENMREIFGAFPDRGSTGGRMLFNALDIFLRSIRILPADGNVKTPVEMVPTAIGGEPEEVPELYELCSPITHVGPDCPPTLIIQGAHDLGGMQADLERLHLKLVEAGVLSIYREFPETEHSFDLILPEISPPAQSATYDTERFLAMMV